MENEYFIGCQLEQELLKCYEHMSSYMATANDDYETATNLIGILSIESFDMLNERLSTIVNGELDAEHNDLVNYAYWRWFKSKSSMMCEHILSDNFAGIYQNPDIYDNKWDIEMLGEKVDVKVLVESKYQKDKINDIDNVEFRNNLCKEYGLMYDRRIKRNCGKNRLYIVICGDWKKKITQKKRCDYQLLLNAMTEQMPRLMSEGFLTLNTGAKCNVVAVG